MKSRIAVELWPQFACPYSECDLVFACPTLQGAKSKAGQHARKAHGTNFRTNSDGTIYEIVLPEKPFEIPKRLKPSNSRFNSAAIIEALSLARLKK